MKLYLSKPYFGLYILNSLFLFFFGLALIYAQLPSGSASQLPEMGLSAELVGYSMAISGVLMLFTKSPGLQIFLSGSMLPYTFAAFLLFLKTGAAQSLIVFAFVQLAMFVIIQFDDLLLRGR